MKIINDKTRKIENKIEMKARVIANYLISGKYKIKCSCGLKFIVEPCDIGCEIDASYTSLSTYCKCGKCYSITPTPPLSQFWTSKWQIVTIRAYRFIKEFAINAMENGQKSKQCDTDNDFPCKDCDEDYCSGCVPIEDYFFFLDLKRKEREIKQKTNAMENE